MISTATAIGETERPGGATGRPRWWLALGTSTVMVVAAGCSGSDDDAESEPTSSSGTDPAVEVGQHASDNPGSVNTFWLEAPDGLVVIDAQRTGSDAELVVEAIEEAGEPVVAILITHPHPDHVGGLGVLHDAFPEATIYASEPTDAHMRTDPLGFYELTRDLLGEDYPAQLTYPDRTLGGDETLDVGGIRLETAEFGPAETESTTAYYEPESGTLFTGDLLNHEATPALLEGHTCGWLAELDQLRDRFPEARAVYPGHGTPGELEDLVDEQRSYLEDFRDLVRPAIDPGSPGGEDVSSGEQASIIEDLESRYPGYPLVAALPTLVEENVAAVARELIAEGPTDADATCPASSSSAPGTSTTSA